MGGSYPKNPPLNPQVRIVVVFAELRCCRGTRAGYVGFNAAAPAQPRTYVISSSGGGAPWAPCVLIPPFVAASCPFFFLLFSARVWADVLPLSSLTLSSPVPMFFIRGLWATFIRVHFVFVVRILDTLLAFGFGSLDFFLEDFLRRSLFFEENLGRFLRRFGVRALRRAPWVGVARSVEV